MKGVEKDRQMVKSVRFVYACMTGRKEAFWVSDSRKSDDDLYVVGRLFNFDIGGDVLCLVSSALALLLCSPLLAAVAILFAAVSNQEKLVTPRLATLDTKSTLEIQHYKMAACRAVLPLLPSITYQIYTFVASIRLRFESYRGWKRQRKVSFGIFWPP